MTANCPPTIYLDNAATTSVDPSVRSVIEDCLSDGGTFANPSSAHVEGRRSAEIVDAARKHLADLLQTTPARLVWTSGATESDNLAILGAARYRASRGRHIVTMPTEHKAVGDAFRALGKSGFDVSSVDPETDGLLDIGKLEAALRDDTQLVSVMHVNNETGVIQDIAAIGALCRERDILFHTDAAQSIGKIPIDLDTLPIDLLSLTGHKFHGPQGIGALYIADRPGCHVEPLTFGGGQEKQLRPGTLPVHLVAGLGEAARIALEQREQDLANYQQLRQRLWDGISGLSGLHRNGADEHACASILNVSAEGVEGESLMLAMEPICVASGSACNSRTGESSYVLRALGRDDLLAQSAVRFSFGRTTTTDDVDLAAARYVESVNRLRDMAPRQIA